MYNRYFVELKYPNNKWHPIPASFSSLAPLRTPRRHLRIFVACEDGDDDGAKSGMPHFEVPFLLESQATRESMDRSDTIRGM